MTTEITEIATIESDMGEPTVLTQFFPPEYRMPRLALRKDGGHLGHLSIDDAEKLAEALRAWVHSARAATPHGKMGGS